MVALQKNGRGQAPPLRQQTHKASNVVAGFIPASQGSHYRNVALARKPGTGLTSLKIRGARGVMSKYPEVAVKIGATQIKLDAKLLGDRWPRVLEEILSSDCA